MKKKGNTKTQKRAQQARGKGLSAARRGNDKGRGLVRQAVKLTPSEGKSSQGPGEREKDEYEGSRK